MPPVTYGGHNEQKAFKTVNMLLNHPDVLMYVLMVQIWRRFIKLCCGQTRVEISLRRSQNGVHLLTSWQMTSVCR